jgi:hypothetical protein
MSLFSFTDSHCFFKLSDSSALTALVRFFSIVCTTSAGASAFPGAEGWGADVTSGSNVSIYHNLFTHHRQRSPVIASGRSHIVNNAAYNYWRGFNHHNPADDTGFNFVGNYYKDGLVHGGSGAWPRDAVTLRTVDEARKSTGSWASSVPDDLTEGLTPHTAPADTDRGGIPDAWDTDRAASVDSNLNR